jgi:hypothetical protein
MNEINVIVPFKWNGMWVFDDARVGLDKEPFVAGADTLIDHIVADIPDAANTKSRYPRPICDVSASS